MRAKPVAPHLVPCWRERDNHRWAVILAGGDGKRLLPLTRRIAGDDRPKQFCSILGNETLLSQTRRRVGRIVSPKKTLVVVTEKHERFYADQVAGLHSSCLLVQPYNCGTGPAIIYSLLRVRALDPRAVIAFFPSDHHFADDEALVAAIEPAFRAAERRFHGVVLLGIKPFRPEVEYGWVEPGTRLTKQGSLFRVSRFWEKPSLALASELMNRGCLWNGFIMVGRVDCFLSLIRRTLPDLVRSVESIEPAFFTGAEREALLDLYSGVTATNFSETVLSAAPYDLAVLSAGDLGWSDLGDTARVLSVLERKGVRPEWAFGVQEEESARYLRVAVG
ncbi:MAG TPA: sugar phosphate nucleotidyltransferase [Terriglobales bacterium]|nr:sugar phosphate nucleotidyltransferase [Terriglobales bacterium]